MLHNHGAAISGLKGEAKTSALIKSWGWKHLKNKADFKGTKFLYEGTKKLEKPPKFQMAVQKRDAHFQSDGLIISPRGSGYILEIKTSNGHGTTEEKVFYDYIKILEGIYDGEYPLIYLFQGPICKEVNEYALFKKMVDALGKPNIHVVFDSTDDLSVFKSFLHKMQ